VSPQPAVSVGFQRDGELSIIDAFVLDARMLTRAINLQASHALRRHILNKFPGRLYRQFIKNGTSEATSADGTFITRATSFRMSFAPLVPHQQCISNDDNADATTAAITPKRNISLPKVLAAQPAQGRDGRVSISTGRRYFYEKIRRRSRRRWHADNNRTNL